MGWFTQIQHHPKFLGLGAPSTYLPQALSWKEANLDPTLPHINLS